MARYFGNYVSEILRDMGEPLNGVLLREAAMTLERVRELLGEAMQADGGIDTLALFKGPGPWRPMLTSLGGYVSYHSAQFSDDHRVSLDGDFTTEQLEAIVCHMRQMGSK